jgi:hypothetical protein
VIVATIGRTPKRALTGYAALHWASTHVHKREPFIAAGIDANIRVVEWNGSENSRELLARNVVSLSKC